MWVSGDRDITYRGERAVGTRIIEVGVHCAESLINRASTHAQ